MEQVFSVAWQPVAKGRPRFTSRSLGNGKTFGRAYTPAKTVQAEASLQSLLLSCEPTAYDAKVPLHLELEFVLPRPKSLPKRLFSWPVVKPDVDNYLKLFCDAANGILWADDAQVVRVLAEKRYAAPDEPTHTVIRVREAPGWHG